MLQCGRLTGRMIDFCNVPTVSTAVRITSKRFSRSSRVLSSLVAADYNNYSSRLPPTRTAASARNRRFNNTHRRTARTIRVAVYFRAVSLPHQNPVSIVRTHVYEHTTSLSNRTRQAAHEEFRGAGKKRKEKRRK